MAGCKDLTYSSFSIDLWHREDRKLRSEQYRNIENNLQKSERSHAFLEACTSFLELQLQEKINEGKFEKLEERFSSHFQQDYKKEITKKVEKNWDTASTVLNFGHSCIALQNVDAYSKQVTAEMTQSVSNLNIDQILPMPAERKGFTNILTAESKWSKFIVNLLHGIKTKNKIKKISQKTNHLVTTSTQTDIMKINTPFVKMSESYLHWKQKYNKPMTKNSFKYCINPAFKKSDPCMTVVETKVRTQMKVTKVKKQNKLRRQSSKLSVCDEDINSNDEFDAYWNNLKIPPRYSASGTY